MREKPDPLEAVNGLRHAVTERLLESLTEVAELKAELRVGMRALDEKLDGSQNSVHEKLDRVLLLARLPAPRQPLSALPDITAPPQQRASGTEVFDEYQL